jgi:hypothetical protein
VGRGGWDWVDRPVRTVQYINQLIVVARKQLNPNAERVNNQGRGKRITHQSEYASQTTQEISALPSTISIPALIQIVSEM